MKKGKSDGLIDDKYMVKFETKDISVSVFKKNYKEKITNKEQEYLLNTCLDLIKLIQISKECLQIEGAYIKNVTGTLKVNPAQKELRENLKAFVSNLAILNLSIGEKDDDVDMDKWLNS